MLMRMVRVWRGLSLGANPTCGSIRFSSTGEAIGRCRGLQTELPVVFPVVCSDLQTGRSYGSLKFDSRTQLIISGQCLGNKRSQCVNYRFVRGGLHQEGDPGP